MRKGVSHVHNTVAWRILEGAVEVSAEGVKSMAQAGDWILPGRYFEQCFSDDALIISIHFSCQWVTGKDLIPPRHREVIASRDFPDLDNRAEELISAIFAAVPDQAAPLNLARLQRAPVNLSVFLEIEGAFLSWFSAWMRVLEIKGVELTETPGIRTEILRAIDYIRRLPLDSPFNEEDLVHVAGLSRSSLLHQYSEVVGMTPHEHYDQLKLEAAEAALQIGDGQIKTLAFELGFKSQSQFSNWFRRRHGVSPRDYREQRQQPT